MIQGATARSPRTAPRPPNRHASRERQAATAPPAWKDRACAARQTTCRPPRRPAWFELPSSSTPRETPAGPQGPKQRAGEGLGLDVPRATNDSGESRGASRLKRPASPHGCREPHVRVATAHAAVRARRRQRVHDSAGEHGCACVQRLQPRHRVPCETQSDKKGEARQAFTWRASKVGDHLLSRIAVSSAARS